ncbi:hypothetical protein [Nocardia jejuensis]|uniref:hypothetical protein n=1 Tax=Nocardia jejuensis TaxID=328049 RepID=UPI001FE02790|nr:hypothetical protein [Nocardia jejuensis]
MVNRLAIDAVVVPSTAHFQSNSVPSELVRRADIVTVSPESTFARIGSGRISGLGQR